MGTVSNSPENASVTCNACNLGMSEVELYVCDFCECVFCQDCAPYRDDDDDAPVDICERCATKEPPKGEGAK